MKDGPGGGRILNRPPPCRHSPRFFLSCTLPLQPGVLLPRFPARIVLFACTCALFLSCRDQGKQPANHGTLVIATGVDAVTPIPGLAANGTDVELAEILFLRLAELGPGLSTVGDHAMVPMLARSWTRRDSVTLVFEMDPRALWHDGVPVTAQDVEFTFSRARQVPALATALARIQSVTAEDSQHVAFRFVQPYSEQLYDAAYHMLILPAHLLSAIPQDSLATSSFSRTLIGTGPFRWVRREPGQVMELAAFDRFFLGRPKIDRVLFRIAGDADTRLNLVLTGEADVAYYLSVAAQDRARSDSTVQLFAARTPTVTYALFNEKANGDRKRPHPILADQRVRQALTLALDRQTMAQSVYGKYATVPDGPVPQTFAWVDEPDHKSEPSDTARARQLLSQAGWIDHNGDGIIDRNGIPFELTVIAPNRTPQRPMLAQQMQERFHQLGIKLNVERLDFAVWLDRRNGGQFDIDMGSANLDPTPGGWRNSWSCATAGKPGQNVGSYCDPRIDSLLALALTASDPTPIYRQILRHMREDAPAIFLAAPANVLTVSRRIAEHPLRTETPWLSLREWSLAPGRQLPRDTASMR
jgi:peptide/nickel transport system substrate-binding protein